MSHAAADDTSAEAAPRPFTAGDVTVHTLVTWAGAMLAVLIFAWNGTWGALVTPDLAVLIVFLIGAGVFVLCWIGAPVAWLLGR